VHGFAWTDIRHLTVHVVGTNDDLTAAWSEVTTAFDGDVPPATLLGAALLGHRGQLVELDAHIERPSRGT
jgi:enamine deaminase RidA (YjgF/YER057c/UK114 family)